MSNPKLLDYFETKIKALINKKVDKIPGKGLSTEDYTTAEKQKLADLDPNPIMVDDELDSTSEDPVQNKVIYAEINSIPKINYVTKTVTNITIPSYGYTSIWSLNNDISNYTVLSVAVVGWDNVNADSYPFYPVFNTAGNEVYMIGKGGSYIGSVTLRVAYKKN